MLPTDYGHVRTVSRETYVGSNLCPSTSGTVSTEPIDAYALAGPLFVSVVLYGAGLVIHLVEKAKGVRQKAATLVRTLSKERAVAAFSSRDRADPRVDNAPPAPEPETVSGVMQVTCPTDGVPGASMEVTADGQQVTVQIPEGAEPNKPFAIKLPVREPEPQPEPAPEPEPAPDDESSLAPPSAP